MSVVLNAQQQVEVSGTITDKAGVPLIGVAVVEHGVQSHGVITDENGKYTISVAPEAVLDISSIGYKMVMEPVHGRNKIDVILQEDNELLEATVVIGYGAIRRSTLANSVTSVRSEDFIQGAVASPLQMLQGKVAGLSVSTASGDPNGGGVQMMLRGVSTLMSNQEPLIVIDGITIGDSVVQN